MNLYRFTLDVEIPPELRPTQVLGAMAEAALALDCYVGDEVPMERVFPPLKAVPDKAHGGSE